MGSSSLEVFRCQACGTKFGHQSSLNRHVRRTCQRPKTGSARRRSCNQCIQKKTRCSLERPICQRCVDQGLTCHYEVSFPRHGVLPEHPVVEASVASVATPGLFGNDLLSCLDDALLPTEPATQEFETSLVHSASSFLLDSLSMTPVSPLATHSMELILRIMRTWPSMLAEEFQAPPLFHSTQILAERLPQPLSHCVTLTKMWYHQSKGSEKLVQDLVVAEVEAILSNFSSYDERALVSALQALVIYILIILSPDKTWQPDSSTDYRVFHRIRRTVQQVVNSSLYTEEERRGARPRWDSWITVTAKRRAILSLYLLHWAYGVYHGVQSYDCQELGFMPAPAARVLWQASTEIEWNGLYQRWLQRWDRQPYLQEEFFTIAPGVMMNPRAERWLSEADEFGLIMMGIVNATDLRQ